MPLYEIAQAYTNCYTYTNTKVKPKNWKPPAGMADPFTMQIMPNMFSDKADTEMTKCATMKIFVDRKCFAFQDTKKRQLDNLKEFFEFDDYLTFAFQRGLANNLREFIDLKELPPPITHLPNRIPLAFQPHLCRSFQLFVLEEREKREDHEFFLKKMRAARTALLLMRRFKLNDELGFINLLGAQRRVIIPNRLLPQERKPPNKLPISFAKS